MGVYSDGSYGIQPGLFYSFPVRCEKGQWSIVQGKVSKSYSSNKDKEFPFLETCQML